MSLNPRSFNRGYFDAHTPKQSAVAGWKKKLQAFLTEVLPDPPATRSGGELSATINIAAVGLTDILAPVGYSREVIELVVFCDGGSNSLQVESDGHVIYLASTLPAKAFLSSPPFELAANRTLSLRTTSANAVTGRLRYEIVPGPLSQRVGGP